MSVFQASGNPHSVVAKRMVTLGAAATLALALAGCSVAGLEPFDDQGGVRQVTRSVGLSPQPVVAPGFVQASRTRELEYIPVGVTPPPRIPLKNPQTLEAELLAKRAQNEAFARAPRPGSSFDGKIEPGYRPPKPAPIPDGGPALTAPAARAAPTVPSGPQPQSAVPLRGETAEQRRLRLQRATEKSGGSD